jgi:hypothetical protein
MDATSIGVTEEKDREQGIDQENIFYCMVFFLVVSLNCRDELG